MNALGVFVPGSPFHFERLFCVQTAEAHSSEEAREGKRLIALFQPIGIAPHFNLTMSCCMNRFGNQGSLK